MENVSCHNPEHLKWRCLDQVVWESSSIFGARCGISLQNFILMLSGSTGPKKNSVGCLWGAKICTELCFSFFQDVGDSEQYKGTLGVGKVLRQEEQGVCLVVAHGWEWGQAGYCFQLTSMCWGFVSVSLIKGTLLLWSQPQESSCQFAGDLPNLLCLQLEENQILYD